MLDAIERKLTSLIANGLAARGHLDVVRAPGGSASIPTARGRLMVSVGEAGSREAFEGGFVSHVGTKSAPVSRRVLPLAFRAHLDFRHQPADNSDSELEKARSLLLDDVALTAHLLSIESVRSGKGFANGAADPGYRVLAFELDKAVVDRDLTSQSLTAAMEYRGAAEIWPPGVTQPDAAIKAVENLVAPLPVELRPARHELTQGDTTRISISALPPSGRRRGGLWLAVQVVSDLPLDQRGTIAGGEPGAAAGVRLVAASMPETIIDYVAPSGDLGATRVEFVAVHLATPDKAMGVFLGSTPIRLLPKKVP